MKRRNKEETKRSQPSSSESDPEFTEKIKKAIIEKRAQILKEIEIILDNDRM